MQEKERKHRPFVSDDPRILAEWDAEKNAPQGLFPDRITQGSTQKVWWKCAIGHEWEARIDHRFVMHANCPYCSGKRPVIGENDLKTRFPKIASFWDREKNKKGPEEYLPRSNKEAFWLCRQCGASYSRQISRQVEGDGLCEACSNAKRGKTHTCRHLETHLSFAGRYPELLSEWDYEKNSVSPEEISPTSTKRVFWKCSVCGQGYPQTPSSKAQGNGCPVCHGKRIVPGYNDIASTHPELAKEWDTEKNGGKGPDTVTRGSDKKVWWKCEKGHSWQATVSSRAGGAGCPECVKHLFTSFPEQAISYYLSKKMQIENRVRICGKEVDILISDSSIGIEYNGWYYHKNRIAKDKEKKRRLNQNGFFLITIVEGTVNIRSGATIFYNRLKCGNNYFSNLEWAIRQIFTEFLNTDPPDINLRRDEQQIYARYLDAERENSIGAKRPDLIKEWNFVKNGNLRPEMIPYGSHKRVWWICKRGHEWQKDIWTRYTGVGCPYCAGKKPIAGETDLATLFPELSKEWDYEKNDPLTPEQITKGSHKKVWWKCANGHEWQAFVYSRTSGSTGCPECAKKKQKE